MTTVQKIARREVSLLPAVIFSVAALPDSFHEAAGPSSLRECAAELASVLGISLFRSHPPYSWLPSVAHWDRELEP